MSKSRPTIVFSVRIDEILYQTGELLKGRHPHTLSQSKIYFAGLKSVITSLVEKGDQISGGCDRGLGQLPAGRGRCPLSRNRRSPGPPKETRPQGSLHLCKSGRG